MVRFNAKQLRVLDPTEKDLNEVRSGRREIYLLLDGVYDTYNVGGIFRLADAVGAKKIFLCGKTECPPNHRVAKSAVGTDKWVEWEYGADAKYQILSIKRQVKGVKVLAIEQSEKSVPLSELELGMPILLVLGSETDGLSAEVLELCDTVVEIPMHGVNKSLNVIVSAAIVLRSFF